MAGGFAGVIDGLGVGEVVKGGLGWDFPAHVLGIGGCGQGLLVLVREFDDSGRQVLFRRRGLNVHGYKLLFIESND